MIALLHRVKYWWIRLVATAGWCTRCGSEMNITRHGQAICPECRRRIQTLF